MRRFGWIQITLGWLLIAGLLYGVFSGWLDRQFNPNPATVLAAQAGQGSDAVVLKRNRDGHYVAEGRINGQPVLFMLDTGATQVALPDSVASRLGLKAGQPVQIGTANGVTLAYRTRLDRVGLGSFELQDVPALISPGIEGDVALLGMSFLKRLEFTQRADELILRQPSLLDPSDR